MAHDSMLGDKNSWDWGEVDKLLTFAFAVSPGAAGMVTANLRAGALTQDLHFAKLAVSLENPPGAGKTITIDVTNGVTTLSVAITGAADNYGTDDVNDFSLDVSAQDLTVSMTATAGTAAGQVTVWIIYHETDIP